MTGKNYVIVKVGKLVFWTSEPFEHKGNFEIIDYATSMKEAQGKVEEIFKT